MKQLFAALLFVAAVTVAAAFSQTPADEPTRQEMERAYRSKSGEGGTFLPGTRWERWRIKEVRGWKLHFKRVGEERSIGMAILKYQAEARKNHQCVEYRIRDTVVIPPVNPEMKPLLVIEPDGVKTCR